MGLGRSTLLFVLSVVEYGIRILEIREIREAPTVCGFNGPKQDFMRITQASRAVPEALQPQGLKLKPDIFTALGFLEAELRSQAGGPQKGRNTFLPRTHILKSIP